jgi:hypothetical protein
VRQISGFSACYFPTSFTAPFADKIKISVAVQSVTIGIGSSTEVLFILSAIRHFMDFE